MPHCVFVRVDWNLLLGYDGGPNHVNNLCDSPVICDKVHVDVCGRYEHTVGQLSFFGLPQRVVTLHT